MAKERNALRSDKAGGNKTPAAKSRADEDQYDSWEKLTPAQKEVVRFILKHSGPEATSVDMHALARSKQRSAHEIAARNERTSIEDLKHLFDMGDVQVRKGVAWNKNLDADLLHGFAEAELKRAFPSEDVLANIVGNARVSDETLSLISGSRLEYWLKSLTNRRILERESRRRALDALKRQDGMD